MVGRVLEMRGEERLNRQLIEEARRLGLIRRRGGRVLLTMRGARAAYLLGEMLRRPMPGWIR
jgi:hypothetical protein